MYKYENPFLGIEDTKSHTLNGDEVRYLTVQDANMRLMNGIVVYRGIPCIVGQFEGAGLGSFNTYDGQYSGVVHMNDYRIDLSSPPLGWGNPDNMPTFFRRNPLRQQQQCLSLQVLANTTPFQARGGWSVPETYKALGDTILGNFPTLGECIERPRGGAFAREWAIARAKGTVDFLLLHNQFGVGYFYQKTKTFEFLENELTKTRNKSLSDLIANNGGGYAIVEYHAR